MQSDDTTLQANTQFLEKVNGLLFPYELCCHGENFSDRFFGIQNIESTMFTTAPFEFWSHERYADLGSYYFKTTPELLPSSLREREKIMRMARKFKKFLAVSPIIWLKYQTTTTSREYSPLYNGTAPCNVRVTDRIGTEPDHERILVMASFRYPEEKWFHDGKLLEEFTWIKLTDEVINLEVRRKKETIKYQISLKMID